MSKNRLRNIGKETREAWQVYILKNHSQERVYVPALGILDEHINQALRDERKRCGDIVWNILYQDKNDHRNEAFAQRITEAIEKNEPKEMPWRNLK